MVLNMHSWVPTVYAIISSRMAKHTDNSTACFVHYSWSPDPLLCECIKLHVCLCRKMKLKNSQKFYSNFIFYGFQSRTRIQDDYIFFSCISLLGSRKKRHHQYNQPSQYRLTNREGAHTTNFQREHRAATHKKMAYREKTSEAPNVTGIIFDVSHSILFANAIYSDGFNAIARIRIN